MFLLLSFYINSFLWKKSIKHLVELLREVRNLFSKQFIFKKQASANIPSYLHGYSPLYGFFVQIQTMGKLM